MRKHTARRHLALSLAALTGAALCAAAPAAQAAPRSQPTGHAFTENVDVDRVPDQFIVKFRPSTAKSSRARGNAYGQIAKATGLKVSEVRGIATGAVLIQTGQKVKGQKAKDFMASVASREDVEYVEPNAMFQPLATPNDPSYADQWHYYESTGGMRLPAAWDTADGAGVNVAVIDTGIVSHTDLNANVVGGYDFISSSADARDGNGRDSNPQDQGDWTVSSDCGGTQPSNSSWHGTHVAGTIAAVSNNSSGVAGVAPKAKIVPVRVLGRCGGSLADIADAIIWSAGGSVYGVPANANVAKVINMSLGGSGTCGSTYQNAVDAAVQRGSTVVVAAGNSNSDTAGFRPANCSNVVAVASTDREGNRASYSNYGTTVDVSAPGGETATRTNGVLSTLNSGTTTPSTQSYAYYQGTSMAAPHVAGLVALMLGEKSLTPAAVESSLKTNARPLPGSCSGGCGAGSVDSAKTIASLGGSTPTPDVLQNGQAVTVSGTTGSETRWTFDVPSGATGVTVKTSGGSGDADLYVRYGAAPTLSTYDCRPYVSGNSETCTLTPQAGTYHVMLHGYAAYSNVSLVASYTGGTSEPAQTYSNTANYTIYDNSTVESPISVSSRTSNGLASTKVAVDIVHTWIGDLKVDLVAPDGSIYVLHNRTGSSADNINGTYTVDLSSEKVAGTWKLRVNDNASGDTGYVNGWSVTF